MNTGKGLAATLIRDTVISYELKTTISNLQQTSDSLNIISQELSQFSKQLNNKNSLLHAVSADTALAGNVKDGIENLKLSTELLNENLKAMRSNFLFRRYFKKNP